MKTIVFILLILSLFAFSYETNDFCWGIYAMCTGQCKMESDVLNRTNPTIVDSRFQVCKKRCQEKIEECLKKIQDTN